MENQEALNKLLLAENKNINNTIQQCYLKLLEWYNANKEDIPEYQAKELSKILHLLEVTENYNDAFKRMHQLEMETSNINCNHSYV